MLFWITGGVAAFILTFISSFGEYCSMYYKGACKPAKSVIFLLTMDVAGSTYFLGASQLPQILAILHVKNQPNKCILTRFHLGVQHHEVVRFGCATTLPSYNPLLLGELHGN